jgi:hypothetical protein
MSPANDLSAQLQAAINLAQNVQHHSEAHEAFQAVAAALRAENPVAADLLQQLWHSYISTQRSSLFWEQLSEVEKNLSDRLSESHMNLKQNYLRLMQEQ